MTGQRSRPGDDVSLRARAEELAREDPDRASDASAALSPEDARKALHELRVHQIELEMQNEELRRAQEELVASRARYFDLYDMAPVGYFRLGEGGTILEANLTAASLLGVARGAVIGLAISRFIVPEDQDAYYRLRRQLTDAGQARTCELRFKREDGVRFWARMEATMAHEASGAPICLAVLSDLTESKRAEETLRESEQRYRALSGSANDAIVTVDRAGTIVGWNPAAHRLFGYTEPEARGQPVTLLIPVRHHHAHLEGMKHVRAGGDSRLFGRVVQVSGRRKDGSECTLELSLASWNRDGEEYFAGIARDVTDRHRAERAFLRDVIDTNPGFIFVKDAEGRFLLVNRGMAEALGTSAAEVIGRREDEFAAGFERVEGEPLPTDEAFATAGGVIVEEEPFRDAAGSLRWLRTARKRLPAVGERPDAVLGVCVDITDRKTSQERERLQREELAHSARLAELGTLVASVAHEVNNPNHFILLNVQFLRSAFDSILPILDGYAHEHGDFAVAGANYSVVRSRLPAVLDGIADGTARIRRIVSELKSLARPGSPALPDLVTLNEVVGSALLLMRSTIARATNHFTTQLAADLPLVRCDRLRLSQVAIALLQNACEALVDSGQAIVVRTYAAARPGGSVLEVANEGTGIPPEVLPQVTRAFFTTKRDRGGTGLGLALVRRIVEEHGGSFHIESLPHGWTLARVMIPASGNPAEELP